MKGQELTKEQYEALKEYEPLLKKLYSHRYMTKDELKFPKVMIDIYQVIHNKYNKGIFKPPRSGCNSCGRSAHQWAKRLANYYFKFQKTIQ